ncbi:MAG: ATP-binding protein [Desulfobacterales bacterium]
MKACEKLGVFYLGKAFDAYTRERRDELILYDSKDLLTHAVIIGMTGSGKTGLGIGLLEEALIDNIPVIAIDPKGDLPNLLLGFPDLRPEDFRPWVQPGDAARQGWSLDQFAEITAAMWRKGLAEWDQEPERIARLRAAADFALYTPGSSAGLPVNVLRSFASPPPEMRSDADLFRERIQSTVTALLTLMGIDADTIIGREHILMSNIFEQAWSAGRGLDLAGLIRSIQQPPLERIGVMDLESFYPSKERFQLALRLNNLLAAPGFEAWLTGDPLDIGQMLHTPAGKPRALIFSISHLPDAERMFFTALLLNEILGWMRTQPGTASLRAILYMDEIYGFFPPVKNPPAKQPLLSLLKQARAFGLGVVLSTQNPVDLDYKGLANTGTWFIGRLQTENDKERVMAGLEGATAGAQFDRQRMGEILSGLGKRVFLLHNVHDSEPVVFETRWTMSFLAGPMTREQIKALSASVPAGQAAAQPAPVAVPPFGPPSQPQSGSVLPPLQPTDVAVFYLPASGAGQGLSYVPAVGGWLDVHYSNRRYGIDVSEAVALAVPIEDGPLPVDWDQALEIGAAPGDIASSPLPGAAFADLPAAAKRSADYKKWRNDMLRWVRQNRPLILYQSKKFKLTSSPGETEGAFRARLTQAAREQRDLEVGNLRRKYAEEYAVLQDRRMRAEQVLAREQEQAKAKKIESVISFGTAILGAFLGRKAVSSGTVTRVGTAMKSAGRLSKEQMDVDRAQETMAAVNNKIADLETRLQNDIDNLDAAYAPVSEPLEEVRVSPRSTDITLAIFGLLWLPYRREAGGRLMPDWS